MNLLIVTPHYRKKNFFLTLPNCCELISIPGFFCSGLWRCFCFSVFAVLLLCRTKPFLQPDLVPEVLQLVEKLELVCPLGVCGGTARGGRHDVNRLGEMQRGGEKSRTISAKHSSVVASGMYSTWELIKGMRINLILSTKDNLL